MTPSRFGPRLHGFVRDRRGASAVEFAIVSVPFIFVLLAILQMGVYYLTQSSLDAAVIQAADTLVNQFNSGAAPSGAAASQSALQSLIVSKTGGMISSSKLIVDLRKFSALQAQAVPIATYYDTGAARDILALRAQAQAVMFLPGFGGVLAVVRSSAIVRRQGQ